MSLPSGFDKEGPPLKITTVNKSENRSYQQGQSVGEGESMQREEEDEATMSDLEKETMEKGRRGVDLKSKKRNYVEGVVVSCGRDIDWEKMKWLSSESQSSEKKSLAGDGRPWS